MALLLLSNDRVRRAPWPFGSFFLGGFECANHLTTEGRRLDIVAASQHDRRAREDYELCLSLGMKAVREAARWPILDRQGNDLEYVARLARQAREVGITLIWDLLHYGYPDDADPFAEEFASRFASFARAVAEVIRAESGPAAYYTTVNEISYYAWAGGEVGYMAPFGKGRGGELKRSLVRCAIAAANAIWEVDDSATMLAVDPLVHLHAPKSRPDLQAEADHFNGDVMTEAMDLVSGRREPELGGSRRHLGIVGLNYYSGNQWVMPTDDERQHSLEAGGSGWVPLSDLLIPLQERYGGPFLIAETGASGDARPGWIAFLAEEAARALERGVDLGGICLYPVVTTPDWEDPTAFFDGGVFDASPRSDGELQRVLSGPVAAALRAAQGALDPENLPRGRAPIPPDDRPRPSPAPPVVRPLQDPVFKADNFSYATLFAGEALVVERYCLGRGGAVPDHRHELTEHAITVLSGEAAVRVGDHRLLVGANATVFTPPGVYHGIINESDEPLIVQQVSAPKPWDSRFGRPHPPMSS